MCKENEWQKKYSMFDGGNLETLGVIKEQERNYHFVEESHPVMGLIKHNEASLGFELKNFCTEEKGDGRLYYKVCDLVMKHVCDVLRKEVFVIKQEAQTSVREELQAIRHELAWQNDCFKALFAHLGLELPACERALECAGGKRGRLE